MLLAAGLSIALLLIVTLTMPWFVVKAFGNTITIHLHEIKLCQQGACVSAPLKQAHGAFPWLGDVTYWGVILLAGAVAYQAGCRLLVGHANALITRIGYTLTVILVLTAFGFGVVTGPDTGTVAMGGVERTWACRNASARASRDCHRRGRCGLPASRRRRATSAQWRRRPRWKRPRAPRPAA